MEGSGSISPPSLPERAKAIIIQPQAEWQRIAREDDVPTRQVITGYWVPLALIGPVCGAIGTILYGGAMVGGDQLYRPSLASGLIGAGVAFVLAFISFLLLTVIADVLASKFGAKRSGERAFKLVAYSFTPALLVGVFSLWPPLMPFSFLGLYSLYLLHAGTVPMLEMPKDKALPYTVVLVLCALVLNLIVAALSAANLALLAGMGLLG